MTERIYKLFLGNGGQAKWVDDLKNELNEMLKGVVVPEMSEIHEQCIYKVPPGIREANPQAYTPRIISIGPFHCPHASSSDNILHQMEELKLKYLKGFLNRTKLSVDDLVSKFQEWENRIRSCYAGLFSFNSNDFLKIIIIDACFIIELFLRSYEYKNWMENDPILLKPLLLRDITHDLVLLENQLPFFVLEDIYELAGIEFPSFLTITIHYFDDEGVLKMPCFHVHDTSEIYMRNIIAFEECHIPNGYISQYLSIIDFLINTEKDVSILVDKRIIVNWMGDANAVAAMVNNLCKKVSMPTLNSKYKYM